MPTVGSRRIAGWWRVPVVLAVLSLLLLSATDAQSNGESTARVCLANVAVFSNNTAIGFCSSAVYAAVKPGTNGDIAYVSNNTANVLSGLTSFCNRKQTYPYVELYVGVRAAGSEVALATMLSDASVRATFITKLIKFVQTNTGCTGIYIDLQTLTAAQSTNYGLFMEKLLADATAAKLKVASGLPWNSVEFADIYFNPTLPKLAFNVLETYEDMYTTLPTTVRPIAPLFAMETPFDSNDLTIFNNLFRWIIKGFNAQNIVLGLPMFSYKYTISGATKFGALGSTAPLTDTYCNALLFATNPQNVQHDVIAGESLATGASTTYVFNTLDAVQQKLNFVIGNNLGGVALSSLNQAGSTNAELLRFVTSTLAPTPPAGFSYPAATNATCGIPVTFPPVPTTTVAPTTTTAATATTAAPGTTTAAPGETTAASLTSVQKH